MGIKWKNLYGKYQSNRLSHKLFDMDIIVNIKRHEFEYVEVDYPPIYVSERSYE